MKILSIGSDKKLFDENSEVRRRIIEYGQLVDELHIVVFTNNKLKIGNWKLKIAKNVFLYPTNSSSRWFYVFDAVKIGARIIRNLKLEIGNSRNNIIVSCQDPFECGLVGWLLKRKFSARGGSASGGKIPLQLQIHTDFLSPYFWKESLLNKIRVLVAKFLIPRADCIRVVSRRIKLSLSEAKIFPKNRRCGRTKFSRSENFRDKRFLEEVFAEHCLAVLPIWVDIEKIKNTPTKTNLHDKYPQFDFIILMASRLTKEKNIGLAIEALRDTNLRIHANDTNNANKKNIGLIIVGAGPEENNLKSKIKNLKLYDNVILEPWTDDIISYYKTADLFLMTSDYEGYGMAVVEAMASGCPVVMTDVGLAGEVLIDKKDGLVVPVGNKEKLTEAILNLIENSELRAELIRNSQKTLSFWPKKEDYLKAYRDSWFYCAEYIDVRG